jgi:hypothetical protein
MLTMLFNLFRGLNFLIYWGWSGWDTNFFPVIDFEWTTRCTEAQHQESKRCLNQKDRIRRRQFHDIDTSGYSMITHHPLSSKKYSDLLNQRRLCQVTYLRCFSLRP